jgi:hypothetical protein
LLSGPRRFPTPLWLGWKAQPSSRAEQVSQGKSPRKGEEGVKKSKQLFPQSGTEGAKGRKVKVVSFLCDLRVLCPSAGGGTRSFLHGLFHSIEAFSASVSRRTAELLWDVAFRGL